jgi:hypothetical protein
MINLLAPAAIGASLMAARAPGIRWGRQLWVAAHALQALWFNHCQPLVTASMRAGSSHPKSVSSAAIAGLLALWYGLGRARRASTPRGARLAKLCHDVIDAQGNVENDGAVYPDSRKLNIFLDLMPQQSSEPVEVVMSLLRPDQSEALRLSQSARPSGYGICKAMFERPDNGAPNSLKHLLVAGSPEWSCMSSTATP